MVMVVVVMMMPVPMMFPVLLVNFHDPDGFGLNRRNKTIQGERQQDQSQQFLHEITIR
jgi:hypothetical protein